MVNEYKRFGTLKLYSNNQNIPLRGMRLSGDHCNMTDDGTMSDLIFIVDLGSVLINNHAKVSNICYGPGEVRTLAVRFHQD